VGKLPPILSILVAVSIVLVVAAVLWWPQRAVAILVQPDRTTYGSGKSVNFTLILKVGGNRPVTVSSPPRPCLWQCRLCGRRRERPADLPRGPEGRFMSCHAGETPATRRNRVL